MPFNARDAQAATYLARRLRDETKGARAWDENGTYAKIAELIGQNLELSLERVFRHAADSNAQTPGAIHRPFVPMAGSEKPPPERRLTREVQCRRCGLFRGDCHCTREARAVDYIDDLPAHPRNPNLDARLAAITTTPEGDSE